MMKILYDIINIIPLSILMTMFFSRYTGMPEDSIIGYSASLIICLLIIILRHLDKKNRIRVIGVTAAFVVGLLIAAGSPFRQLIITEYRWLGWNFCISAVAVVTGILTENIWIRRTAAISLLAFCVLAIVCRMDVSKLAFVLILFLLCIYTTDEIQRRWKKKGYPDIKGHVTLTAPVLLALCITVYFIPAPDTPYDWQFAKDIYNRAVVYISKIYNYFSHPREEYVYMGFSDSSGFYDNLRQNDREVLVVKSDHTRIRNLRLVGCISGEYDGTEWTFDTKTESPDRMMDTLETLCAVRKYDGERASDYIRKTDLRYENLLPNTKFIFTPSKLRAEAMINDNPPYTERNNSLITDRRMNSGDGYSFSHYVLNTDKPEFVNMLNTAKPVSETEWKNVVEDATVDENKYSFSDYQEYRNSIYDKYGTPTGVSEEVGQILDEISSNSQNRYELMKNLEAYLKGMEYSTADGTLPSSVCDGRSYLDYFLLTSQKGYCIHYATAFVLMAREMGVPCRYVQGYYAPTESAYIVIVKQSQAHAWPEVYFDNVGWVAFEPTPGYSTESSWITTNGQDNSFSYYDEDAYTDYEEDADDNTTDDKEKDKSDHFDARLIIVPVLSVAGFLVLLYIYNRIHTKLKYKRMENDEKFRHLTRENLNLLRHVGYRMKTGETLAEYKEKLCDSKEYDMTGYVDFISYYEELIYSDICINDQHIADAEKTYTFLRGINKGRLRHRIKSLLSR